VEGSSEGGFPRQHLVEIGRVGGEEEGGDVGFRKELCGVFEGQAERTEACQEVGRLVRTRRFLCSHSIMISTVGAKKIENNGSA
jgi:hypothetical protein